MTTENLPEALNRLANLKYLNLSGLQREHWLSRGQIAFGNIKNLVYLDLSCCSVHVVLDNLGSLTKLQHLNLSGCWSCFDDCTELHRYSQMSEAIGNLTELHYLNLSNCSGIQEHPNQAFFAFLECIGNLLNLEHLDLSCNPSLRSLPDCFRRLRKLHTLDLSCCGNLQDLPSFLNEMDKLKFLELENCIGLDQSKQNQLNKSLAVLPHFVVHADCHDSGSNLFLINDVNRTDLVISRLENVKSTQEARSIRLAGKDRMKTLELNWTKDVERFVEDMDVLGELVPPTTLELLEIDGYNSVRFPEWFVGNIAFHLPNLVRISMSDFPKCNSLPPLGRLPNLSYLVLERMNGISEINWDLCGSRRAFPRLGFFTLCGMESLKVWYTTTTHPGGRDGVSEFMFPNLSNLKISDCPNLRLVPCPNRVFQRWDIEGRIDGVMSSQISVSSSPAVIKCLLVSGCKVPMHQWRLFYHLRGLTELSINECSDLSSSPEIIGGLSSVRRMKLGTAKLWGDLELPNWLGQLASLEDLIVRCNQVKAPHDGFPHLTRLRSLRLSGFGSMTTVQQWVGSLVSLQRLEISSCENLNHLADSFGRLSSLKDLHIRMCDSITYLPESIGCLTSLNRLCIINCARITSLPGSIQQLTKLERLDILECEELEKWCKNEENKAKLAHIKEKTINDWSQFFQEDSF